MSKFNSKKIQLARLNDFNIKYKIWIETIDQTGVLGDGKWRFLKTLNETNCMGAAMKIHNLSYRKTWDNLNKIEEILGFSIICRQRGGKFGGKTTLTPKGKAIVDAFDEFHKKHDSYIRSALEELQSKISENI